MTAPAFAWTEEHRDLRSTVRRLLATRAPVSRARELADAGARHDPATWSTLVDQLGLPGLGVAEEHGGSGATLVDVAVVAEEMGRVLLGGPWLSTAVLSAEVLTAHTEQPGGAPLAVDLLGRLAEGRLTAAVAICEGLAEWSPGAVDTTARPDGGDSEDGGVVLSGTKVLVLDGAEADVLLVLARGADGLAWYVVEAGDAPADGLERTACQVLDATRPMASVTLRATPARPLGAVEGWQVAERVQRTASIVLAAEQVGMAAALVELTSAHATTRWQFGRPIGSFQGVKHRLADMAVRHEMARSAAYWAAWQEPGSPEQATGALVARSYCTDAVLQSAKDTIQLHGGIGFTWEHDAHLYLRRARADATLLGSTREAREQLLAVVLADGPGVDTAPAPFSELQEASA